MVSGHIYSSSMSSRNQRGPSSPLQQIPNSGSLLQSPSYPSPAQSDTEPPRYTGDGLGLYQYSQPFSASADRAMFLPSPQPTHPWNGTTSMASAPIVNPWTSGAYDHPVCPDNRSDLLWPEYHSSHRSSISSQREMSVFSGDGSEHSFPAIKLENGAGWAPDNEHSHLATVAPDRLTNPSYESVYGSPMSHYESDSTSGSVYKIEITGQFSPSMRPRSSQSDDKDRPARRRNYRRTKVPDEEAKFRCEICGTGFVRAYNKKTHMARHNPNRSRDHHCPYDCDNKFERKTDLTRHINSVHLGLKPEQCDLCGKKFARKDTLNRHRHDPQGKGGCPRRNEVDVPTLIARSQSLQSSPAVPQSYLPSPQPDVYADASHGLFGSRGQQRANRGIFDGRFSRLPSAGFGNGPHGL